MLTYFLPINIFKLILKYCDDRIEKKQKYHYQLCLKKLNNITNFYNLGFGKNFINLQKSNQLTYLNNYLIKQYPILLKKESIEKKNIERERKRKLKIFSKPLRQAKYYKRLRLTGLSSKLAMKQLLTNN